MQPTRAAERIESLDLLRGFALLGILLLNIIGFGLTSSEYSYPGAGMDTADTVDVATWATVELLAEGAMRALFSILFGAGVLLFLDGRRSALHFRRTFWLLVFGLFDAYVLLWSGDILVTYALAGAVLWFARRWRPRALLVAATVVFVLASASHGLLAFVLDAGRSAAAEIAAADDPSSLPTELHQWATGWHEFESDYVVADEARAAELEARRGSYASAFAWNREETTGMLVFVVPVFLFWDALMMMLLGMGLYRLGILQGDRSTSFYVRMAAIGFAIGLAVNGLEIADGLRADLALHATFAQLEPTYHLGRLAMAFGWLGAVLAVMRSGMLTALRERLAAVGRMALTNYLMHSLIALVLFTGAGFGLVGELSRAELYPVVFAIWALQLVVSPWWLARFRFGPVEWLWRALTYGERPPLRIRTGPAQSAQEPPPRR